MSDLRYMTDFMTLFHKKVEPPNNSKSHINLIQCKLLTKSNFQPSSFDNTKNLLKIPRYKAT